jgi:hypothetical protein
MANKKMRPPATKMTGIIRKMIKPNSGYSSGSVEK